jgi:rSAM/selenodomain-associated transferase 1
VKTRLASVLGDAAAARLHARLVERTLATALAASCGTVELHGSPARHAILRTLAGRHAARLRDQTEGDIGARMLAAFRSGLRRYRRVILIGSDCPALRAADLRRAARLLQGCDAVLAPAEDGGYPLLGLSRVSSRLFEGIPWGSDAVLGMTRQRLFALDWRWHELRTLWDVDRPADLARLVESRLLERRP